MKRVIVFTALLQVAAAGALELPHAPALGSGLEALDRGQFACTAVNSGVLCRSERVSNLIFEGEPVRSLVLFYRGGVLARATVALDEARFEAIAELLRAQFGAGEERPERLKAGMGGAFANPIRVWRDRGDTVMLERYFERIIHSGVTVMRKAEFAALMAERDASRVRGVRDL